MKLARTFIHIFNSNIILETEKDYKNAQQLKKKDPIINFLPFQTRYTLSK